LPLSVIAKQRFRLQLFLKEARLFPNDEPVCGNPSSCRNFFQRADAPTQQSMATMTEGRTKACDSAGAMNDD